MSAAARTFHGISHARECPCGALALGAPLPDFDEVIDDAIDHFALSPDPWTVNFRPPRLWLAEWGIDIREGGEEDRGHPLGAVQWFWFRRRG
jgi:hypothetical protein